VQSKDRQVQQMAGVHGTFFLYIFDMAIKEADPQADNQQFSTLKKLTERLSVYAIA